MSRHQKRFKDKHQYMTNDYSDDTGRYYSKGYISDDESPKRQMHLYDEERENSYKHSKDRKHKTRQAKSDQDYPEEKHRRLKNSDSYGIRHVRSSNYSKEIRKHRYEEKEQNEIIDSSVTENKDRVTNKELPTEPPVKKKKNENLTLMTGGAYIPPAKLKMMQEKITDKSSADFQRIAWEALKKSIIGLTNKINISNISDIVRELFKENLIRGRGVLTRAVMQAQAASPTFTHVYAALVAIINTKFPEVSELILKRVIIQFKRGFRRNDKQACLSSTRYIAHLLNQQVAHEVVVLEILTLLLEKPTDDSVEVAISLLKECGMKLTELSPKGILAIFERLRNILHEGNLDKRVQYMIEVMFAIRKDSFKDHIDVIKELDLVEEDDKYTHLITLEEAVDAQDNLNVFKYDPEYEANEEKYKSIIKEILGDSSGSEESEHSEGESDSEDEEESEEKANENQQIIDQTETNLVSLRRNIYLTIQSSLDFEECAHKLLKMELKPGQITEMCYMILDCCAQQRTYEKFYGLLAQRFCQLNKIYMEPFMEIFKNSYETIHRLETNKLRNVAKFFAHLLYTDAIPWLVLSNIRLNEEDTTSSSRIFIKILFQELCEYMGLPKLNERVKDVTLQEAFDGLFPRDNPHNTRFAINFFTSIGLGGLTDELREHLKSMPKNPIVPNTVEPTDNSPSDESSQESAPSSAEESEESEEDSDAHKKKKQGKKAKAHKSSKPHSKKQSEVVDITSKSARKLKKKKKKRKKSKHKAEKE